MNERYNNEYYEWLESLMCCNRSAVSYRKLLMHLHRTPFKWKIRMDENRAAEGIALRYRFCLENGYPEDIRDSITGPCSVLEMMVALAIHCEENIMDDPKYGDRTAQWFWGMINNLGLGDMMDDRYDRDTVEKTIRIFLKREYAPNGKGGLFTIRNTNTDLRQVEIWHQLCWYIDSIVGY